MSRYDNRATLEKMIESLYAGDLDGAMAHMADDAVVEWPQSGERIVGRQACFLVYKNYPGGSPAYTLRRISGEGDHFTVEAVADYHGRKSYVTNIVEFRDGRIVKQTDYFAEPYDAPAWRSGWVERMEMV